MIASDAVQHSEDEEPHTGDDENCVKHEILQADQMRTLMMAETWRVDLDQEATVGMLRCLRNDVLHI